MEKAVSYFKSAAILPAGDAADTFPAANIWAQGSSFLDRSPLEAFAQCIELISRRIWLGASLNQRYADLASTVQNLVHEAVTAAISLKRYDLALEWLEEGRAVVWQQMLQLRTPFDRISDVDEKLAQEFQKTSLELEQASSPHQPSEEGGLLSDTLSERVAHDQQRLALRWEELLGQARSLPGFENFLKPKRFSELLVAANSKTIVMINTGASQCDAIVLLPGCTTPAHVRLANMTHEKVVNMGDQLRSSLSGDRLRYPFFNPQDAQDHFREVLLILWMDIVEPVLKDLGYLKPRSPGEELPHIVWCTTGPLSFLPLHAAGNYDDPQSRVFRYAISSYSPTLGTLVASGRDTSAFQGILCVGQAAGDSGPILPGTAVELDLIQQKAGPLPFTRLDNERATSEVVLGAMESHSWVHLACHASQNIAEPTASAFQLHGGDLKLATITRRKFKHAEFAFLSACQTAMGDEKLPDEAIHLAAGMLMVGYPSVIATMWSINDQDAPLVAERVYARMLEGGVPDSSKSARALHEAVEYLRNQIGEEKFARWVPFIHMGR
ncbi:hypothetical protein FRC10_011925 [Ceratobasidium sp. 414]|nr:hypothetical protein FRC10_011925 [Ceratobasidium sp. 414]